MNTLGLSLSSPMPQFRGGVLAATVACRQSAGIAANATDLWVEDGKLVAARTIYSGNISAQIHFESPLAVASVRPRSFPHAEAWRRVRNCGFVVCCAE